MTQQKEGRMRHDEHGGEEAKRQRYYNREKKQTAP